MRERAVKVPGLEPKITIRPPKRQISTPSRHSLKCAICNHPDRAAIEFDFLNWRNPGDLVKSYRFRGLSTIYRHAHATGLFAKRRLNLRFAMERIVERVNEVPVTATSVIRAARAIARINDSGEWVDPPSRVIVTHINFEEPAEPQAKNGLCSGRSNAVRAGTSLVGRGLSPDIERDAPRRSLSRASRGSRPVRDTSAHDASAALATRHSSLASVFDEVLLDEPSDSASAELPRIEGKPAPPEVILELTPEFARCREERRLALEADRRAKGEILCPAGHDQGPTAHQDASRGTGSQPVHDNSERRSASGLATNPETVPLPTPQEEQSVASSPSLLPQAAVENSAQFASRSSDRDAFSALPHRAGFENNAADNKENVASPSSTLPEAAPDKPATAMQSPRAAGPPLGSSGSANPPFPFTPERLPRWNPRRRF